MFGHAVIQTILCEFGATLRVSKQLLFSGHKFPLQIERQEKPQWLTAFQ
jgi:hypothetical protein